jgi:hypothetical protein
MDNLDKTGKEYEKFVANLYQAILDSEKYCNHNNITIEKNKKIIDNNGKYREFDLYWEYELGGLTYKTVVECKDYKSPISVEKIDALIGKVKDIPDLLKLVFASKNGYQSGAKEKAIKNDIELLIVREQKESDWINEYGEHYLKIIDTTIYISEHPKITRLNTLLDGKWIKENKPNIDITKPLQIEPFTKETLIEDVENNRTYSLEEFFNMLIKDEHTPGNYTRTHKFSCSYLLHNKEKFKLHSLEFDFCVPIPDELRITVDYTNELLGVIEYINKREKKLIFKDVIVQQNSPG